MKEQKEKIYNEIVAKKKERLQQLSQNWPKWTSDDMIKWIKRQLLTDSKFKDNSESIISQISEKIQLIPIPPKYYFNNIDKELIRDYFGIREETHIEIIYDRIEKLIKEYPIKKDEHILQH